MSNKNSLLEQAKKDCKHPLDTNIGERWMQAQEFLQEHGSKVLSYVKQQGDHKGPNGWECVIPYVDARICYDLLQALSGFGFGFGNSPMTAGIWEYKNSKGESKGVEFSEIGVSVYDIETSKVVSGPHYEVGDMAMIAPYKSLRSDAYKRACVALGIGRDAYEYPKVYINGTLGAKWRNALSKITELCLEGALSKTDNVYLEESNGKVAIKVGHDLTKAEVIDAVAGLTKKKTTPPKKEEAKVETTALTVVATEEVPFIGYPDVANHTVKAWMGTPDAVSFMNLHPDFKCRFINKENDLEEAITWSDGYLYTRTFDGTNKRRFIFVIGRDGNKGEFIELTDFQAKAHCNATKENPVGTKLVPHLWK